MKENNSYIIELDGDQRRAHIDASSEDQLRQFPKKIREAIKDLKGPLPPGF